MDSITRGIAEYVCSLEWDDVSEPARRATCTRIMDTLACAWGGIDAPAVAISKRAMLRGGLHGPVNLIGGGTAPAEEAAFLNALMSRVLELNDWSPPTFHGSDMVMPLVALAEELGRDGRETVLALIAAHQVFGAFNKAFGVNNKRIGWDGTTMLAAGTAAGAAKLLRLDEQGVADAVSIAVSGGPATRVRGTGTVTIWTRGEGPQECMIAIWAAILAAEGMPGPAEPFEGLFGLWQMVTGEFDLRHLTHENGFYIEETMTKLIPASFAGHAPIVAAIGMRDEIGDIGRIASIHIDTYDFVKNGIGKPESWHIATPEEADHSLPFLLALALAEGEVKLSSFTQESIARTDLRDLMAKTTVAENPAFSAAFPEEFMHELTVTMDDGRVVHRLSTVPPPGHARNPATPEQLAAKFHDLMGARLSEECIERICREVDRFDELESLKVVTGVLPDVAPPRGAR